MFQAIADLVGYSGKEYDIVIYILSAGLVLVFFDRLTAFITSFFK